LVKKQKELGTITDEDLKISNQFNNAILDLKDIFGALTRDLARVVVPIFTKIVETFYSFVEYIRKHKILVLGFFAALLIALTPILFALGKMAIASVAAFAPFYAIVAVVTAIALIFEDIYYYFMGWDSATGKLLQKFPIFKGLVEGLRPIVMGIVDTFNSILDFLKNPSWDNFAKILKNIGTLVVSALKLPFEYIKKAVDALIEKFPYLAILLKPLKIIIDSIKEVFDYIINLINNFSIEGIKNQFTSLKNSIVDIGTLIINLIKTPFDYISKAVDALIEKFPIMETALKPIKIIVDSIVEVFKWLIDAISNFSLDKITEGLKSIKDDIVSFGSNIVDSINPMNWFGDDTPLAPAVPAQSSVINNANANSNTYNINNNINQNISSATPKQLADGTNQIMINSINAQRQQKGAL
ncbi:phage tail protein, partial [Campylobacter jejuni]